MSFGPGRVRRPDDWPSSHVRAREALSDRLDGVIQPADEAWLETHLAECPDCRTIAAEYAAQRLELRAMRDRMPEPPRDLWARTASAIERESRFRDGRPSAGRRRSLLAPVAMISAAVVVAVVAGTLVVRPPAAKDTPGSSIEVALASPATTASSAPGSLVPSGTPIPVPGQQIEWLTQDADGVFRIKTASVDEVCPADAVEPCDTAAPTSDQPIAIEQPPSSVFGSPDGDRLIVVSKPDASDSGTVSVLSLASPTTGPEPTPTVAPSPTVSPSVASPSPSPSPSAPAPTRTPRPTATVSAPPTSTPSASPPPSPSIDVPPSSEPGGPVEIARGVVLVGQSAAYSPSGTWFAFTARPIDGSAGPDIYVWRVGDPLARAVTTDHHSVFGSWVGDIAVGSTAVATATAGGPAGASEFAGASFLLDPATGATTPLPQTGRSWRPTVDPSGRQAVYWAGSLRGATAVPEFLPDAGRLVLGDWGAAGAASPSGGPLPTTPIDDQGADRHETTIAAGRMEDWDARWDSTGTRLAVWIADAQDPSVGRLSLYVVDAFDGRIDLKKPLLDAAPATAGFALADRQLVWAEPSTDGTPTGGRIQVLAWTDDGSGTVETVPGPVIVIR